MVTILGQPPSKSSCYRVITIRGHASLGKAKALKAYEESFFLQCPERGRDLDGRFALDVNVYFRSDQPDLDNALKVILDCLQACKVIRNDRKCARITANKFVDKLNPRIEYQLTPMLHEEPEK